MMRKILAFVKQLLADSPEKSEDPYTLGFRDALHQVQEYIEDQLWERGEG